MFNAARSSRQCAGPPFPRDRGRRRGRGAARCEARRPPEAARSCPGRAAPQPPAPRRRSRHPPLRCDWLSASPRDRPAGHGLDSGAVDFVASQVARSAIGCGRHYKAPR